MYDRDRESFRVRWWMWTAAAAVVSLIIFFFVFTSHVVQPGTVGVYYDAPFMWGNEGVRKEQVVKPGRVFTWSTTSVIPVSTAPWTVKIRVDDMMSSNKVPLDFDVAITFRMKNDMSAPAMISKFNGGPVTAFSRIAMPGLNTDTLTATNPSGEFMSFLRDQVRGRHMDEFLVAVGTDNKPSDANNVVEKAAVTHMNGFLDKEDAGVMVTNIALGRANPPDGVKASMERTAEQVQMKTTESDRATAQRARKAAEEASAEADKAQQIKLGFTNEQYLKKLEIEAMLKICGSSSKELKDNKGSANCTFIYGSQAVPTYSVK